MDIKRGIYNFERKLNSFNKDMTEGGYEKISDVELDKVLYIYEPQSMAELPEGSTELDYQKVWHKFQNGGHINIYLVPYREAETVKIQITAAAATFDDVTRDDALTGITNVKISTRPTKRFYSFTKLTESDQSLDGIEFFEEVDLTEVLNNDSSIKQTTFRLAKFNPYDGGKASYYRDVKFYYGLFKPDNVTYAQIEFNAPSIIGEIGFNDVYGSNITREVEKINVNDTVIFNEVQLTEEGYTIGFTNENQLFPHFLVPTNTGQEIHWGLPWSWEFMYITEQHNHLVITGDGTNDNKHASNGLFDNTDKLYRNDTSNLSYRHINNGEFGGTAEQTNFFMPYVVEFGLPRQLSSHGSTFANDAESSQGSGLFNLDYTDNSLNGARATNASGTGSWYTGTTIFAVDYAYDPSAWIAGSMDLYLTNANYGAFWQSVDYENLLREILNGSPVYQGSVFSSTIDILADISSQNMNNDLRKWSQSQDNKLLLLPWDPVQVCNGYKDEPEFLDSRVIIGIKRPKDRTGIWDWSGGQSLSVVDGSYMFGKYLDNRKVSSALIQRKLLFKLDKGDLSQLSLNYKAFGAGDISVKLFSLVDDVIYPTYEISYKNEVSQGRTLSGGTVITWI